jgi:hypothetical protein
LATSPRTIVPWGLALIAVVAAGTFGFALQRERTTGSEVEATARRFAQALLTYDSGSLDQARDRVRPLVTDGFFKNYEGTLAALAEVNSSAEGKATEVFLDLKSADRAAAVVVTDSTATSAAGPSRTQGSYLRLDLVSQGGRWRVDKVVELFAGRRQGPVPPREE